MFRKRRGAHERPPHTDGLDEARRRFGGMDLPAAAAGVLAALGLTVLLGAVTAVVIAIRHDQGVGESRLWVAGGITAFAVMAVAVFAGAWVGGRSARYDGVLNGWLSAGLFTLLVCALAGAGRWADSRWHLLKDVQPPGWLASPSMTGEVATAIAAVPLVLIAAALGGGIGARYHRKADSLLVTAPPAAVTGDATIDLTRSEKQKARQVVR